MQPGNSANAAELIGRVVGAAQTLQGKYGPEYGRACTALRRDTPNIIGVVELEACHLLENEMPTRG